MINAVGCSWILDKRFVFQTNYKITPMGFVELNFYLHENHSTAQGNMSLCIADLQVEYPPSQSTCYMVAKKDLL